MLDEQAFEVLAVEPYERKLDGQRVPLLTLEARCPVCGVSYRCKTGLSVAYLPRRCEAHRNPGKPVKGKRGRRVSVSVVLP